MDKTVAIFDKKKQAIKFIETISFKSWYQEVKVIYREKKWYVYYREWRDD